LVFGGLVGWVTGILATPDDPTQQALFSRNAATISAFISGFIVAKLDRLFEESLKQTYWTQEVAAQWLILGCAFLLGLLFTVIGRLYWRWTQQPPQQS
jgi:hypothetical protein